MSDAYKVAFVADIPEKISITFETTGVRGSDRGGNAELMISVERGAHAFRLQRQPGWWDELADCDLILTASGDWEVEGLETALLSIGQQIAVKRAERQAKPQKRLPKRNPIKPLLPEDSGI